MMNTIQKMMNYCWKRITLRKLFSPKEKGGRPGVKNNQKRKKSEMNQVNISVNNVKSHSQRRITSQDTIGTYIRIKLLL